MARASMREVRRFVKGVKEYLQRLSSDPSRQSFFPSHLREMWKQVPSMQLWKPRVALQLSGRRVTLASVRTIRPASWWGRESKRGKEDNGVKLRGTWRGDMFANKSVGVRVSQFGWDVDAKGGARVGEGINCQSDRITELCSRWGAPLSSA